MPQTSPRLAILGAGPVGWQQVDDVFGLLDAT